MKLLTTFKKELLILLVITVVYFGLRIPNLVYQPIFADEAIYIRWAQVMRAEPTLRFLPLTDGKTPLFMWIMIPFFKIFEDPLFAGRLLSVFSGYATLLGVLAIGWKFFNRQTGLIGAFFISVIPFFIFFDRLALVDSMLAAFAIWSLFVGLLLVRYPRIDLAMALGYLMGGSMLVKPPGFFNLVTLPLTAIIFAWRDKNREGKFLKLFGLWIITFVITFGIYNILRLGAGFSNLSSRNQDYIFSPTRLLINPFDPLIPHLWDLWRWSYLLLSLPLTIFIVLGIVLVLLKRNRVGLVILGWSFVPLAAECLLLQTFTARYVLFTVIPLVVIGSFGVSLFLEKFLKNQVLRVVLFGLLLIWPAYFLYNLHFNLPNTPLPANERRGYLEDWTAGYSFKEIAQYLDELSKISPVVVGTEGTFGTLPDGLQIYLEKNRQVIVIGGKATVSAQLRNAAKDHPTFFVTNKSRYQYPEDNIELIKEYIKAKGPVLAQDAILFYRVYPDQVATNSANPVKK